MGWRNGGIDASTGYSYFGIEAVGADSGGLDGAIPTIPMKMSEVGQNPTTKILLMDWPAAPDRPLNQVAAWHGVTGKAYFDILYGDGHAKAFLFTADQRVPQVAEDSPVDLAHRGYW